MITIIGIDPGQSGGIAVISGNYYHAIKMPETEKDIYEHLKDIINTGKVNSEVICFLEKVHTMPTTAMGSMRCSCGRIHKTLKVIQGSASQGKFMQGYGTLRGMLIALGVRLEEVTPQKWQKAFVTSKARTESKTDHKNKLKAKAQLLFPDLKITLKTADALLIAEFGRLQQ